MSKEFENKVVIVTGSSSGIGKETVLAFAQLGALVVITGRNEERVIQTALECQQLSPNKQECLYLVGDVNDDEFLKTLIEKTINKFSRIDILVNNAGVVRKTKTGDSASIQSFDEILRTNVRSVYLLSQLAVEHLIKTKGSIINISSVAGLRPYNDLTAYCCSKAALDMITKCFALDLGPKGVRVNSVNPAAIETPIFETFTEPLEMKELREYCKTTYPLQRIGDPKEVANAVVFLASENSSFTTGHLFASDGGSLLIR